MGRFEKLGGGDVQTDVRTYGNSTLWSKKGTNRPTECKVYFIVSVKSVPVKQKRVRLRDKQTDRQTDRLR